MNPVKNNCNTEPSKRYYSTFVYILKEKTNSEEYTYYKFEL